MKLVNLTESFATAILDFDINNATHDDIKKIKDLIYQRKVVSIKNQNINREAYLKFAKNFGSLEQFKLKNYHDPEYPNILVINNKNAGNAVGARKLGNMWHSDSSYLTTPLPLTFLHAQKLPSHGGDTLFIDMQSALEALPSNLLNQIEGRKAAHDVKLTYKVKSEDLGESIQEIFTRLASSFPATYHQTIMVHPITGHKNLFMNPGYTTSKITGYTDDESQSLLTQIFEHVIRPEKIFAYKWENNDLLIWDNRSVLHCATEVAREEERLMYRIGVNDGDFFANGQMP
ncbi:TauD/TfdA family dioxygenase [Acinetobacter baumannii]|uniref:TauD/TfdA dioxygenase family protein n=1 Tax=Acinetobacter baumannii TaxID=470 RepID=UPI0023400D47|nr:TauD/TfdA family dioxygenase [Acinetobacter baumannii]MDC4414438.1 TauD/TfdA family dioxygenase [Acinetobacter baumannii]MDH2520315.1 TauD/TfdA family dioxygenase [Acinetobacter baumannii]MDK2200810.1 TauD/TfdA family dioxygenase [Acinetobacter baumannii]